jgi:hypothetical protein
MEETGAQQMQDYKVKVDSEGNERWFNMSGRLHREGGPAVTFADGSQFWYKNGQPHRIGGPAIIYADGGEEYWINGICQ